MTSQWLGFFFGDHFAENKAWVSPLLVCGCMSHREMPMIEYIRKSLDCVFIFSPQACDTKLEMNTFTSLKIQRHCHVRTQHEVNFKISHFWGNDGLSPPTGTPYKAGMLAGGWQPGVCVPCGASSIIQQAPSWLAAHLCESCSLCGVHTHGFGTRTPPD